MCWPLFTGSLTADTLTPSLLSLVPDYELTPSPASSLIEFQSSPAEGSPMLRLSDSEDESESPTKNAPTEEATTENDPTDEAPTENALAEEAPTGVATQVASSVAALAKAPCTNTPFTTPRQSIRRSPATSWPTPAASSRTSTTAAPSPSPTPYDDIEYVPSLDTYFSPGSLHNIGVQLKKNLCSECGVRRPKNWCPHLRRAGLKAGLKIQESPVYLKNLTQLRKNQRADKGWVQTSNIE